MTVFFGKYRGSVENNVDPMQLGRVQVSVPAVLGQGTLSWAMPCVPYAGSGVGFFAIPPVGAHVWVEFEGGDPDYPIWAGCYWALGEVPALPAIAETKVFKTEYVALQLSDLPGAGGVTLEVGSPAVAMPLRMVFDSNGIEIDNAPANLVITQSKIELKHTGPTVAITPSGVEIKADPASLKVEPSAIEAADGASSLKLSDSSVEIKSSAEGKFSSSGVELANGGQSIKVGSSNVSINDGSIEAM